MSRTCRSTACRRPRRFAKELFKAFGGEGGVVAIGGILSNVPAIERKLGLDQAIAGINGKVTLLDFQPADWNETEGLRHHAGLAHPLRRQDQGRVRRQ